MKQCKCGRYLTTEGVARHNQSCAKCARLQRERSKGSGE